MAHAAETAGDRAGRAAAIEDRALAQTDTAMPVIAASSSAVAWLTDNACFADQAGECRATYIRAYLAAYHRELREHSEESSP